MEPTPNAANPLLITPNWKAVLLHAKRAFKPDFGAGVASPEERAALPAVGNQAQDYLAWRRSVLQIAFVMLALSAVFALVTFALDAAKQDNTQNQPFDKELVNAMAFTAVLAKSFLAAMVFLAWKHWRDLPRAHRRVKLGWVVGLLVPFVIALVPVSELLKLGGRTHELGREQLMGVQFLGLIIGLVSFLQLLPSVISVFVGALRAGLMTTRFLPESAIPGWVVGMAAPVLSLLILAIFVLLNQIAGNTLLLVGFSLVILNFLLYARFGPRLARSYRREDLEREFGQLRKQSGLLLGGGCVCILIALFSIEFLGMKVVGTGDAKLFSYLQFVEIIIELIGKSTITMLLFSDFLISAIRHARGTTATFQGSELAAALDLRLGELQGAGVNAIADLGRFRTGSPERQP